MKEARTANSTYKKLAVQWLNEVFFSLASLVRADNLVLRNLPLPHVLFSPKVILSFGGINFHSLLHLLSHYR